MATKSGGETSRMPGWLQVTWEWTKSILFALGLALLIRWPVAEPFKIPSGSMEPTLHGDERVGRGDRIFVNKHAYGVRWPFNGFRFPWAEESLWYTDKWLWEGPMPDRWDIVVFKSVEPRAEHDTLVKRVVALPGEEVRIGEDGRLYIDGKPIEMPPDLKDIRYEIPFLQNGYGLPWSNAERAIVPEGHVFLLGDNSLNSRDARWWGWVPHHHLIGEATSIWWPVSRWRDFTGFSRSWWWIGGWMLIGGYTIFRLFLGRSWKLRDDAFGGAVRTGEHLIIRFSLGLPIPFTGIRVSRGRDPQRGDLVLFHPPKNAKNAPDHMFGVIAGLPGERVSMETGKILIDDAPPEEPAWLRDLEFSREGIDGKFGKSRSKEFALVPEDAYFVVSNGDDRAWDSRTVGWIPRKRLIGHAIRVWWPVRARRALH
jgi:signal peptidase I